MANPVLLNDLRKSWFRRRPVHAVALMAFLILALTLFVAAGIPSLFGWSSNSYPFWRFPDLLLPIIAPAFAAGAFAREHEQRTWQDVLLTRLRPAEILSGKFWACFFPTVATIIVLFPPFALILIIEDMHWAQEPGPWMVAVAVKFLITAVFYLAVSLVCSYHCTNVRVSLVIGYVVLALYAMANFFVWQALIEIDMASHSASTPPSGFAASPGYSVTMDPNTNGLLSLSQTQFGFSRIDVMYMFQAVVLSSALFLYLLFCIRGRRAPNL